MNRASAIVAASILLASPGWAQAGVIISRPSATEAVPLSGAAVTVPFQATLVLIPPYIPCGSVTHTWTRDDADAQSCSGVGCSVSYYESASTRGAHTARLSLDYHWANINFPGCFPAHVEASRSYVVRYPTTAQITGAPWRLSAGQPGSFSGAGTSDPDYAGGLTYQWTFGDGGGASGPNVSHAWSKCGDYVVQLTVSDGALTATATTWVNVTSAICKTKIQ